MSRVRSVRVTLVKLQRMTFFFCRFHNLATRYKRKTRAAQGRSYWLVETHRDKAAAVDWLALQYVTGNMLQATNSSEGLIKTLSSNYAVHHRRID